MARCAFAALCAAACLSPSLVQGVAAPVCEGTALEGCLQRLTTHGLGLLGATRELLLHCGDENPLLDLLAGQRLPPSRTRDALVADPLSPRVAASLKVLADASAVLRRHATRVWALAVEYAYSCFVLGVACAAGTELQEMLLVAHTEFLGEGASFLGNVANNGRKEVGGQVDLWVPSLGDPPHIIAKSFFSPRHVDFSSSVLSGLQAMEAESALGVLHDLSLRVGFANCEMQAQLLAHFTLSSLLPPGCSVAKLPRFEFHGGACCRRYHVLADVIANLGEEQAHEAPTRMVEVGVNNAITSKYLLSRLPDLVIDGVDPYIDAEDIHTEARMRLAEFGDRAHLRRLRSVDATSSFALASLDIVFVDGDHARDAVAADIRSWAPLVRPGGLLAGHDLFNPAFEGVLEALLEYAGNTSDVSGGPLTVHFAPDFVWWLRV